MEFEDILEDVGGYGKFLRQLTVFFLLPVSFVSPWFWMSLIFMVSTPDHWCSAPDHSAFNTSIDVQRSMTSSRRESSCIMYNSSYRSLLEVQFAVPNATDTIPCSDWEYDTSTYDSTVVTKWNLVCSNSHYPSMVLTFQNLGNLLGTSLFGLFSDKFGRKLTLIVLSFLIFVTELSCVFVDNFIIFSILRVIQGSTLSSEFSQPAILSLELTPSERRAHMNGILNIGWSFGICILPLIVYLARSWVILAIINAAVSACLMLFYWWYLPESPCWLVSQGRYEEAKKIMMRIGEVNGKPPDPNILLRKLQTLGESIKKKKEKENKTSESSLLKYPRLRRSFFILTFCWATNSVAYTGPIYNVNNLSGNEFINFFLMSVVELPGTILFWVLMDRTGRRWTASVGFLVSGIMYLIPVLGFPYSDIVSSMIGKLLIAGIYIVSDQQATELYPTVARSFGIGTGKTIANALTLFLPYIAYLSFYGKSLPFLVMSFTCILAAVLSSFLPETLNENLPQAISDAENFGRDRKFFSWTKGKISKPDPSPFCYHIEDVRV